MDDTLSIGWVLLFAAVGIWELVWKGLALWQAGKRQDKIWFILLLVINTAGILPIIYILKNKD